MPDLPDVNEFSQSEAELSLELASHPHDAYFKRVFSDVGHARRFFQGHLSSELVAGLKWSELSLLPGSFVKRTLQQSHSDLLFSVPTDASAEPVLLYLLFEHQTSADKSLPLRLLGYILELWPESEAPGSLRPIIPFVLHQGPERWSVSLEFADLIVMPPDLAGSLEGFVPRFRHALLDLSQHQPKDEEEDEQLRVVLQLMKMARDHQSLEFLSWMARQVIRLPERLLRVTLLYALHIEETVDVEAIFHTLNSNPELQSTTMSLAQRLINQGLDKGMERGLEKGLERGRDLGVWIGKIQFLQEMMGVLVDDPQALSLRSLDELKQQFDVLQAAYNERFKNR